MSADGKVAGHLPEEELELLRGLAEAIGTAPEVEQVLDLIARKAIEATHATQASIMLAGEKGEETARTLVREAERTREREVASPVARMAAGFVFHHGTGLDAPRIAEDDRFRNLKFDREEIRSVLGVPLRLQGRFTGVLVLSNGPEAPEFDPQDRRLAEIIAAHAAAFIENIRLLNELRALNESLEMKVRERTRELEDANRELSQAYDDLQAAQTRLIQSEKMASLGHLVAGIAHEINTPMGAIKNNVDLFARSFRRLQEENGPPDPDQIAGALEKMAALNEINQEAVGRIVQIVKGLRSFARLDEAEMQRADLHEGLDNTLLLLRHELKDRIEIVKEYGEIRLIACHANQLNQVFMNLLVNASHAIEGKGRITVRTGRSDNQVFVQIEDTGRGIPEEHLDKIFDPGFTTKGFGIGTGLGLSICYQIVDAHDGRIEVGSKVGKGSTFTIYLPIR